VGGPPSTAWRAAVAAIPSVSFAFSLVWTIEAPICSTLAVLCSTEAAWSLDGFEIDWVVAETWPEALLSLSAALCTWQMISPSLSRVH
jgi:hypothetical protein